MDKLLEVAARGYPLDKGLERGSGQLSRLNQEGVIQSGSLYVDIRPMMRQAIGGQSTGERAGERAWERASRMFCRARWI
jgi:hypothetical protein